MVAPFVKRPTSPLHFEPAVTSPEDILCLGSDDEDNPDHRHRKRRRVEELGQKYLEGKPLFILSASLRGPLNQGWVNPWAKKKHGAVEEHLREPASKAVLNNFMGKIASNREVTIHDADKSQPPALVKDRFTRPDIMNPGNSKLKSHAPTFLSEPDLSTSWLRSDEAFLRARTKDTIRQPTPTPIARSPPPATYHSGFTPINKRPTAVHPFATRELQPSVLDYSHSSTQEELHGSPYRQIEFREADNDTRVGYVSAKRLSQRAAEQARNEHGHLGAKRLAEQATLQASRAASRLRSEPSRLLIRPGNQGDFVPAVEQPKVPPNEPKATPFELPPSTNLSGFQYRRANKMPAREHESLEGISFAEQMKAAKAEAEAQSIKRLSFMASNKMKSFGSRSSSRGSSTTPQGSAAIAEQVSLPSQANSPGGEPATFKGLGPVSTDGQVQGNEAQRVSMLSAQLGALPSGPSLNPTDSNNPTNEDDSYLDLSTQAAISKAQHSFANHVVSPLQKSPKRLGGAITEPSPTAFKTPSASLGPMQLSLTKPDIPHLNFKAPAVEALSTQAMMDAISPFAVTTVKKIVSSNRPMKQTAFAASPPDSPLHNFGNNRRSLSMSTSPESPSPIIQKLSPKSTSTFKRPPALSKVSTIISKPPSTAASTAFSIAPNGTLTEVNQQDGQQLDDVGMGIGIGMESWDLDEAIEEAGSFLATGAWDVEAEARKEGHAFVATSGKQ